MSEDNTSVLGYASSKDGETIRRRLPEPAYVPREEFEQKLSGPTGNSGCEDPRIVKIGRKLYMTYTAFDGVHPWHVALTSISEKDFLTEHFEKWSKPVIITPSNIGDKNMCLVPKKINGEYMFLHRIERQICADFLPDLEFKDHTVNRCIEIMGPRPGMWDSTKVGIAAPPIETSKGWLLIYHGVSRSMTYRLGVALLDLENPTLLIARTVDPILEPIEPYEKEGQVRNVVFSCGAARRGDTIYIYYGGADSVIGVGTLSLKKLLRILLPKECENV
jgi:predicted GH43/DUF377 family glycosyl hydrolase